MTQKTTKATNKDFASSGVEGQKGQDAEQVTQQSPSEDAPADPEPVDTGVVTIEDVLKNQRAKGVKI